MPRIKLYKQVSKYKWVLLSLVFVVFLSGCQRLNLNKTPTPLVVGDHELIGSGHTFDTKRMGRFMDGEAVYLVEDEAELALLMMKRFENKMYKTRYASDVPLSLERIIAYLEMLVPHTFALQAGVIRYGGLLNLKQEEVRFIDIVFDVDQHKINEQEASEIIKSLNILHENRKNQIRAIHDYLVANTVYDSQLQSFDVSEYRDHPSFSPYGVYIHHQAVCSGYARAFMQLAHILDIPTVMITSQNMNHAWNMVFVDDQWLFVDATWDDPVPDVPGRVLHTYYLLGLKQFKGKGHHFFDLASDSTLGIEEMMAYANYVFGLH
ncbi:MAG: hypothetical protein GX845_02285 [Erysipelothrix sp.]|nr:hypothetical protein [Erysipelothrix sp.]